jgi:hypothetical protein
MSNIVNDGCACKLKLAFLRVVSKNGRASSVVGNFSVSHWLPNAEKIIRSARDKATAVRSSFENVLDREETRLSVLPNIK